MHQHYCTATECPKICYTRNQARAAANRIGAGARAYECEHCGEWHATKFSSDMYKKLIEPKVLRRTNVKQGVKDDEKKTVSP